MLQSLNSELGELLNYKNPALITYFCHHYPQYSVQEAQLLFADLLCWMWLNVQRTKEGKKTYLFGPLLPLDDLWHAFILHTRDYLKFSQHYFGDYFHHDIEPAGQEHLIEEEELTDFLQDCFIYLDSSWVERHFSAALL